MNFITSYKQGTEVSYAAPDVIKGLGIAPGVYSDGLLTVLDAKLSAKISEAWMWLLGPDVVPVATTAFGDFFFWSGSQGAAFFMDAQSGKPTFVDRELAHVFNEFLTKDGVKDQVLGGHIFPVLVQRLGALSYGRCYIAVPSLMFGGNGAVDTYSTGDIDVYLSLTGQTTKQRLDAIRSP
jgi:hypothetical protein